MKLLHEVGNDKIGINFCEIEEIKSRLPQVDFEELTLNRDSIGSISWNHQELTRVAFGNINIKTVLSFDDFDFINIFFAA